MVIDLHAKNLVNICKGLEKKSTENCLIAEIHQVQGQLFRQKSMYRNETRTWSVSHGDWLTRQSAEHLQAFRKKVLKTVWSLKITKSKACNFAKSRWSVTKLELDL